MKPLKIIFTLFIISAMIFMSCSLAFSLEFDNIKSSPIINATTSSYGVIEIRNSFAGIEWLAMDKVATVELIDNGCNGQTSCYAILKVKSYDDSASLINDIEFIGEDGELDTNTTFSYEYISGTEEVIVNDYKEVLDKTLVNGTQLYRLDVVGTHKITRNIWSELNKTNDKFLGERTIRIDGVKPIGKDIDWKITIRDVKLNAWAWWYSVAPTYYWKLNEVSNINANDSGLGGLNLTDKAGDIVRQTGKLNNAANFTGANGKGLYNKTSSALGLARSIGDNNFTMALWINASDTDDTAGIISGGQDVNSWLTDRGNWALVHFTDGRLQWQFRGQSSTPACNLPAGTIKNGYWYRVVAVREGNQSGMNQTKIYINGALNITCTADSRVDLVNFALGWNIAYDDTSWAYNGMVDDVQIYNNSRWQLADVVSDYNLGVGREADTDLPIPSTATINLTSPIVNFNVTTRGTNNLGYFTANCSSNSTNPLVNLSLFVNGLTAYSVTNTTSFENLSLQYDVTSLGESWGNWTCYSYNQTAQIGSASNRSFYVVPQVTTINLSIPTVNQNFTTTSITFNGSANSTQGLWNVTLWLDGIQNYTFNVSTIVVSGTTVPDVTGVYLENGVYDSAPSYRRTDGTYWLWKGNAFSAWSISTSVGSAGGNFASFGTHVGTPYWGDYDGMGGYTGTAKVAYNNNISAQTIVTGLSQGWHNWTLSSNTNSSNMSWASANRSFYIDSLPPSINIVVPTNGSTVTDGWVFGHNRTIELNFTVADVGLQRCWVYNYSSGLNSSPFVCGTNVTFNLSYGTYNFYAYVNDTMGNNAYNRSTARYDYTVWELWRSHNNQTIEGNVERFYLNASIKPGVTISLVNLIYNGTYYPATIVNALGGNNYSIRRDLAIPDVSADRNQTAWWEIRLNDGSSANGSLLNQTVLFLGLDNCTAYNSMIINFTIRDEENQSLLDPTLFNVTAEADTQIYTIGTDTVVINYTHSYYQINPIQMCLNINLTTSPLRMYSQVRYGTVLHSNEFYNLQNFTLSNVTVSNNSLHIPLYDLLLTDTTNFLITYKDSNFLPVGNAIIDVTRKYIAEGVYKSVESPLTDTYGKTLVHLDTDGVLYTIIVKKNGAVLGAWNNIIAHCENAATGDCKINLNTLNSGISSDEFILKNNVSYNNDFNKDTRTITTTFTTTTGAPMTILLNATKYDRWGKTQVCSDSLTSSSGSLLCTVPISYANTTIIANIYSGGVLIGTQTYSLAEDPDTYFGGARVVMILILLLTIPMMFMPDLIGIIIGLFAGLIMAACLMIFSSGSILGSASAIIWLLVAGGIVIYRLANRER